MEPTGPTAHAFTVRVPEPEFSALKAFAFYTDASLNEVVVRAVREFLVNHGGAQEIEAMAERARALYRDALERLATPDDPGP